MRREKQQKREWGWWGAESGCWEKQGGGGGRIGRGKLTAGILSGLLLAGAASVEAAEFIPLGFFPGFGYSRAYGASADGSVVVGIPTTPQGWVELFAGQQPMA